MTSLLKTLVSVMLAIAEILHAWTQRLYNYVTSRSEEDRLTGKLRTATNYADWFRVAVALDNLPDRYNWRVNPVDYVFDFRHLDERRKELRRLRVTDQPFEIIDYIQHGLLRNLFNITRPALFEGNYTTTKESVEWYIDESVEAIRYVGESPTAPTSIGGRLTDQLKLEALYAARGTFGRSALLLQGGSIFGLCHLGVVKALNEHNLLPNVIVGTATGALMAALVGIHTREELPAFLNSNNIDLSAFTEATMRAKEKTENERALFEEPPPKSKLHNWFNTFERRCWRLMEEGFLLDPAILAECVKANVGDMTFEEAFKRTGRILNIIISSPSQEIPDLMNYLTAPAVLIRSAALASHITNMARHRDSPIQLLEKDFQGNIRTVPMRAPRDNAKPRRPPSVMDRKTPLTRLKQLFNVDHFIISQARPYIAPFVSPSLSYTRKPKTSTQKSLQYLLSLVHFTDLLKQVLINADIWGVLPDSLRRVLSDETVKGHSLTLVPELEFKDWWRLLKNPTKEEVDFWIMRGERSVWPALCALKVRCLIEISLDQEYQKVHRRRPSDPEPPNYMGRMYAAVTPPLGCNSSIRTIAGDPFDSEAGRKRKVPRLTLNVEGDDAVHYSSDETVTEV